MKTPPPTNPMYMYDCRKVVGNPYCTATHILWANSWGLVAAADFEILMQ